MTFANKLYIAGSLSNHQGTTDVFEPATELADADRAGIIGPITSIVAFDDTTDPRAMANDRDAGGLTAYIFTCDLAQAEHWAADHLYGEVQSNGVNYGSDLPHGGIGQSGTGRDGSMLALHDHLVVKRITRALGEQAA